MLKPFIITITKSSGFRTKDVITKIVARADTYKEAVAFAKKEYKTLFKRGWIMDIYGEKVDLDNWLAGTTGTGRFSA